LPRIVAMFVHPLRVNPLSDLDEAPRNLVGKNAPS
jgi:hypothetical protein